MGVYMIGSADEWMTVGSNSFNDTSAFAHVLLIESIFSSMQHEATVRATHSIMSAAVSAV